MTYPHIVARKPKDNEGNEYIVVQRPTNPGEPESWVSATANALSLACGEWFWGHYFTTREEAMAHFDSRTRKE